MKKRILLLFVVIPFLLGLSVAYFQSKPMSKGEAAFQNNHIPLTDMITIVNKGDIYTLTQNSTVQITHNQNLIEPVKIGSNFAAIEKTTNNASLFLFDQNGNKIKTLYNGNANSVDSMTWITDPAVNADNSKVAYVSDKDRLQTNVPDNGLYVMNLSSEKSTNIAKPDPYSGGLARPTFNPTNDNIILYDYYQYDPQTLTPYSTIEQFDNSSSQMTTLTYEDKNAYQQSLSPDGKHILFLGRNADLHTVTLYIADYDSTNGLSNTQSLLTGDLAYPVFSNSQNHIYFLQAQGNGNYNLLSGVIKKGKLTSIQSVISGNTLKGISSYMVTKVNN